MKNISQLLAISYAVKEQRENRIKKAGLWEDFKNSKYTSMAWYLRSIGRYDLYQEAWGMKKEYNKEMQERRKKIMERWLKGNEKGKK